MLWTIGERETKAQNVHGRRSRSTSFELPSRYSCKHPGHVFDRRVDAFVDPRRVEVTCETNVVQSVLDREIAQVAGVQLGVWRAAAIVAVFQARQPLRLESRQYLQWWKSRPSADLRCFRPARRRQSEGLDWPSGCCSSRESSSKVPRSGLA